MRQGHGLVVLSLLGLAACGVEAEPRAPAAPPASTSAAPSPSPSSSASVEAARGDAPAPVGARNASSTATANDCIEVWDCDLVCGELINGTLEFFPTNVLHLVCSDGSDTVLRTDPCGEQCF